MPAEHTLRVTTTRRATLGTCSCGHWEISISNSGLGTGGLVDRNHALHVTNSSFPRK